MKLPKWISGLGSHDDAYEDEPLGPDIADDDYIIQDARRGGYAVFRNGKQVLFRHVRMDVLVRAITLKMMRDKFYPNIWYVNERGNTDLLDSKGNILKSWV